MLYKILIFTVFAISFGTWAQLCIPESVGPITVEDKTLSWSASRNCGENETRYIVAINSSDNSHYEFIVTELRLEVLFLSRCRNYSFTVTPLANYTLGPASTVNAEYALPKGKDIVVRDVRGVQSGDDVLMRFLGEIDYSNCVEYYHVLTWSEDSSIPDSVYVFKDRYTVKHAVPCMNYRFNITAHYNDRDGTTSQIDYTVPAKPNIPSLVDIKQSSSSINTTWSLEKFTVNRCKVMTLYVNGTHFNQTYQIEDTSERPDVEVSITGLAADSVYSFNVTVENSGGISEAVQVILKTLPIDPRDD